MRVVHISTFSGGGAGIAALRLHRALQHNKETASFFLFVNGNSPDPADATIVKAKQPPPSLKERVLRKFKFNKSAFQKRKKYLNKLPQGSYEVISFPDSDFKLEQHPLVKNADVVHLHWVAGAIDLKRFFSNINKPVVWTLHDMNPFMGVFHYEEDRLLNHRAYQHLDDEIRLLKQRLLNQVQNLTIVCLCKWMENKSLQSILKPFPHFIIPNAVDGNLFRLLNKEEVRRNLGIPGDAFTILMVAENVGNRRKGMGLLLEALQQIDFPIHAVLVGEGEPELPEHVTVKALGKISDSSRLNEAYAAADLVVIPSREDNLPNVMLEAFACGRPVLSFANGGMYDWILPGENGIIAEELSSIHLAKEIRAVYEGKYHFNEERIRAHCEQYFSPSVQGEKMLSLYKSIVV